MIIKLKNVRIAFSQHLFVPGAVNVGYKPAYSSTFLIPKDDVQIDMVRKTIDHVATEKWEKKASEILKALVAGGKVCLHDGALKANYEGFEGCM